MKISEQQFLILIALWAFCFHFQVGSIQSQCLEDQQSLLIQLKQNLTFSRSPVRGSNKLASWDPSRDCCVWGGLTCSGSGHVIGLDLSNESISGGIDNSSSLFDLHHLRSLNLASNSFMGAPIPSGFSKLANMRYLNLSSAGFSGQVPADISGLTRLVSLSLESEFLSEAQPGLKLENPNLLMLVRNLTRLTELNLGGCDLSAEGHGWCRSLSSLTRLRVLNLAYCQLSGSIDSSLAKLRSLSVINLAGNLISGQVPEFFGNFSDLTSLDLSSCSLNGTFPEKIFQLPHLQHLDVSTNYDLQGLLPEFPENGSLETLVLTDTSFGGHLPDSIANLERLSRIEIAQCNFSGLLPSFSSAKNLSYINLSNNHLSGSILSTNWSGLSMFEGLYLSNNSLTGAIPISLFGNPSLRAVFLDHNQFSGIQDGALGYASSAMEELDLSSNELAGPLPVFISRLRSLVFLRLSSTKLRGPVNVSLFQQMMNLSVLDLSFNGVWINDTGVDLASLPLIRSISLASCQLTGFPTFLKEQTELTVLDLSNNKIGDIPDWIWQLEHLSYLNLSRNFLENFRVQGFKSHMRLLDLSWNKLQGRPPNLLSDYVDYSSNNFSFIPSDVGEFLNDTYFFSLANNNLRGSIPQSICNATFLGVLNLSNNSLNGTIPQCLFGMGHLQVLNLRRNNLSGNISDTFSSDCEVKTIDLNGNHLEGRVPRSLANCTSLEVLDLGNNHFYDTFPCYLGTLSTLRVLILRSNRFQGSIGCSNGNFSWQLLQIVDLASNNFSGILPVQDLRAWKAMMDSDDEVRQIQVNTPNGSSYQDSTTITSKGSEILLAKILTIFTSIDFSCNNFEGKIPSVMGEFRALYFLNLSHNSFSSVIPSSLGDLGHLESLDLSSNYLSGEIPQQLADLNFLEVLNLSNNSLNGTIPQCLFGMGHLQVLNLRRNNLSGNISDTFSSDCEVKTIDLNGNHLEGRVPRSLANCTSLEVLDLGNNHFYDTFPCYLGTLSTLRVLILRSNRFHRSIGCSNGNFSWQLLQIVDLASNNFSGILPVQDLRAWKAMMDSVDEVRQIQVNTPNGRVYYQDSITTTMKGLEIQLVKILTIFTSIDFSCNNFEGNIPEVIGEFKALYILNFSHNSFTSQIPSSMGNLHSLESLDLSNNNLSGKIPQQLADLNFLAVLNLSRNQLEGRIPSGGQFQTFSEDSFKDNKGLCGVLLNESCSPNAPPPPPPPPPPRASDDGVHVNWKYISVEIGFVFGLAIVILPLMFWRRWRIWYYRHADVLLSRLFPRWMQRSRNRGSRTSRRAQLRERNKMVGEVALQPPIS